MKDRRSTVGTGSPQSLPTIEGSSDGGSSSGLRRLHATFLAGNRRFVTRIGRSS